MRVNVGSFAMMAMLALVAGTDANAQATRTWVSGVGDDANPCSRTAPCKTFAGAISKTAAGGEINALDAGGYGAVTITKSITLDGAGTHASILASGTNGIIVNGANVKVTIRNLSINGVSPTTPGFNGVRFLQGARLTVENVVIQNFSSEAVRFAPSGSADLVILNSTLTGNGSGVLTQPGAGAFANAMISNSRIESAATFAIRADDRSVLSVKGSVLYGNGTHGVNANAGTGPVSVTVADTISSNNGMYGYLAQVTGGGTSLLTIVNSQSVQNAGDGVRSTGGAVIRLAGSAITNNGGVGINPAGGSILSAGNNLNQGNASPGAPSGSMALQ